MIRANKLFKEGYIVILSSFHVLLHNGYVCVADVAGV